MATIQGIYIALFGRPADPLGLDFFENATGGGADLTAIGDLAATAEYQDRFDGMNNAQVVTAIYQSLFNRAPELAGLTFFVNALNNGDLNINNVAIAILDGAQGSDLEVITNKEAAADAFTAAIAENPAALAAYNGTAGAAAGRLYLAPITADPASVPDLDTAIDNLVDGAIPGANFTFTTGVDELIGTDGNDTFRAVHSDPAAPLHVPGTLNPLDYADGGAGVDTLYIDVDFANAWSHSATLKGFEIVELDQTDAILTVIDSDLFDGSLQQLWQTGQFGDLEVGANITAGFRGDPVILNNTLTVKDGVSEAFVALDQVADTSTVIFAETTPGDLATVNVSGSVISSDDGVADLTLTAVGTELTLNLAISSNSQIDIATFVAAETIDASASTGDLTFDASATVGITILGGSGNDDIVTSATTEYLEAGVGADVVDLSAGGGVVTTAVVVNEGDTGLLPGAIDSYTGFFGAAQGANSDTIDFGIEGGSFLDIGNNGAGSGFIDALTNANTTFAADAEDDLHYVFSHNGVDGWLIVDADLDGTADYAIEFIGLGAAGMELVAADIIM